MRHKRFPAQPPVQGKVSYEVRPGCWSRAVSSVVLQTSKMETQHLWTAFSPAGLSSWGKIFFLYIDCTSHFKLCSQSLIVLEHTKSFVQSLAPSSLWPLHRYWESPSGHLQSLHFSKLSCLEKCFWLHIPELMSNTLSPRHHPHWLLLWSHPQVSTQLVPHKRSTSSRCSFT